MSVRDDILAAVLAALTPLAVEVEMEPSGDPSEFSALAIFDFGHRVIEREAEVTRRELSLTIEGYVEGSGGAVPTAQRTALHEATVRALLGDPTLLALIELIDDDDLRMMNANLASKRRLAFAQDFTIQFTTSRADPALPA